MQYDGQVVTENPSHTANKTEYALARVSLKQLCTLFGTVTLLHIVYEYKDIQYSTGQQRTAGARSSLYTKRGQ